MNFEIRKAIISDADSIGHVHIVSWQTAYHGIISDEYLQSLSASEKAERFKNHILNLTNTFYFVAELNKSIIGNLTLHKCRDDDLNDFGEIGAIYLLPEYWDKGYGKQMMDFSENFLKNMGFRSISLWVLERNYRARNFYEKCGFVFEGTKKEIIIGNHLIEIRYTKVVN